jgi:hypothetical protein
MSLKTQGIILGNIHIHIVLFYFFGSKLSRALYETNREMRVLQIPLNLVHNRNATPVSTQIHFFINPDRLNTLECLS